ncbi:MAG: peptide-binding protein [Deltaproteobacteria bacterium]|nr:MAG: peptide-binding protein [Deltaproteobacteria bacterium]
MVRPRLSKILLVIGFLCILPVAASPVQGQPKDTPAYGDTIIVGSIGDASNLIPILASDSASHDIAGLVYNGLVKYDKDLKLVGDLAKSWDISPDGLTITFHLRKNVKWQDGKPFTSDDVLFTYKITIDPKTPTPYAGDFMMVKNVTCPDPYTVKVTYPKPFAPALGSWGSAILPKHLLDKGPITKSPLIRHPVGTGPYIFDKWITGEKIVLHSNPDYFEGRPYIDRYIYRIIPDMATMFMELQNGTLDEMGLTPLQYKRQTNTPFFKKNFRKYNYLSFSYTYLGYNLKEPLFKDRRVRQAISYAIDKKEIVEGVLFGLGKVSTGPYKPGTWYYNPNVKRYPYNPEKARKLLEACGWKKSPKDGLLYKNGRPFEFTIITNQGNNSRMKTAEIIQWRLRMIGIRVKIRTIEWASFIRQFIDKRRFQAVILGWTTGQDPDLFDIWHSSKIKANGLNFISYRNREVDRLLEEGRTTFDMEKRKKAYHRLQEILAEDQPYTFLYIPMSLPIIHARFHGIKPAPAGISYNFIRWYVPKRLQRYKYKQ